MRTREGFLRENSDVLFGGGEGPPNKTLINPNKMRALNLILLGFIRAVALDFQFVPSKQPGNQGPQPLIKADLTSIKVY